MRHSATALLCLSALVGCLVALGGCGPSELRTPKSWLYLPVSLEVGSTLRFRVQIEQQLSHGKDVTSELKSDIQLAVHVARRQGGALRLEVTRTGDGEGKDFHFLVMPNDEFGRVRGFQFPSAISTTFGEYSIKQLTQPHFWLHDMLRPLLKSRFEKGETWNISPVFDGVPFPIPMLFVANITSLDEQRVTIEAQGDIAWGTLDRGAPDLVAWPRKSLRTSGGKIVVNRRDGLVESAEWTLEMVNDRDWTLQDGSFPEPDGKRHTVRNLIRVTRL